MNNAMILCAGFGLRLGELTKDLPKPMLQIGNMPILEYSIKHLVKFGVNKIIINLHFLPEKIFNYFGSGKKYGVKIYYSYEKELLGTAGSVKNVEKLLKKEKDFLILYGDVITNQDYNNLLNFHISSGAISTIIMHKSNNSNSIIETKDNGQITKFLERPSEKISNIKNYWVNSGIYCFNNQIFNYLEEEKNLDFPKDIFPKLVDDNTLFGLPLSGYRCAIDSIDRYLKVKKDFDLNLF